MKHLITIYCLFISFNAYSQINLDSLQAVDVDGDLFDSVYEVLGLNFAFLQLGLDTISIHIDSTVSFTYRGKSFSNIKDDMDGIRIMASFRHGSSMMALEYNSGRLREKLVLKRSPMYSRYYVEYLIHRNEENKAFFHRKNIIENIHVKGYYYASEDLFNYLGLNDGMEIPNDKCGLWTFIYPEKESKVNLEECN